MPNGARLKLCAAEANKKVFNILFTRLMMRFEQACARLMKAYAMRMKESEMNSRQFQLKGLKIIPRFLLSYLILVGVLLIIFVPAIAQDNQGKVPAGKVAKSTDGTSSSITTNLEAEGALPATPSSPFGNISEDLKGPKTVTPENTEFRLFPRDSVSGFFEKWQPSVPVIPVERSEKAGQNPFGSIPRDLNRNPFGNTPSDTRKNPFGNVPE